MCKTNPAILNGLIQLQALSVRQFLLHMWCLWLPGTHQACTCVEGAQTSCVHAPRRAFTQIHPFTAPLHSPFISINNSKKYLIPQTWQRAKVKDQHWGKYKLECLEELKLMDKPMLPSSVMLQQWCYSLTGGRPSQNTVCTSQPGQLLCSSIPHLPPQHNRGWC